MSGRKALIDSGGEEGGYAAEELSIRRFQEQTVVVATPQAGHGRGSWAEDLNCAVPHGLMSSCRVSEQLSGPACIGFRAGMDAHRNQTREGWIADLCTLLDLLGVEAFVVVLGGESDRRMIRLKRLKNDFAGVVGTARAARHLSK